MKSSASLWVGGAAGDGVGAAGEAFVKACARAGLHAYAYTSRQSVTRGGHVLFQAEAGPEPKTCVPDFPDLLVALNQDTIDREAKDPIHGVIYDKDRFKLDARSLRPGAKDFGLSVPELSSDPLARSMAALGAALQLTGLGLDSLAAREGAAAAKAGFDYAARHFGGIGARLRAGGPSRPVLTGSRAFAAGAAAAGCGFFSADPSSSILRWLAPRAAGFGIVVEQAEDELSAMSMAVGAAHAGARAMTAASGGGFALMSEALGLAAMIETPVVCVEVQSGGPSTGLPTKTEQADLWQVLGAGPGDYPKAVLAPATVEEAFHFTAKAFNLAERFQIPVVLMSDLLLSEQQSTAEGLDFNAAIDRGVWAAPGHDGAGFLRYKDAETGVSPRAVPGQEGLLFVASSDEHDERGDLLSGARADPAKRVMMMSKRMRKLEHVAKEMPATALEGPPQADVTLLGWGSTYGMMLRVMEHFNQGGRSRVNVLCLRSLWPFPWKEVSNFLYGAKRVLAMETNYGGQLCRLVRQETGFYVNHRWFKFDGEPFYPGTTLSFVEEVLRHG